LAGVVEDERSESGTETYTHSSLTNGTTYYYRISAVDDAGIESDKTSDVSSLPHDSLAHTPPKKLPMVSRINPTVRVISVM